MPTPIRFSPLATWSAQILLFAMVASSCGSSPENFSTLAVAEDICDQRSDQLSAVTTMNVGELTIIRLERDPCRRTSKAGFGLLADEVPQATGTVQNAVVIDFSNERMTGEGEPYVARENGKNHFVPPHNEAMVNDGADFAANTLRQNGVNVTRIHNPSSPQDLQQQLEAARQKNPALGSDPLVIFHGHHTDDGKQGGFVSTPVDPKTGRPSPAFHEDLDYTRAAFAGLGQPEHMTCLYSGCQTGGVPGRIEADPTLKDHVTAVGSSGRNELSFGTGVNPQPLTDPATGQPHLGEDGKPILVPRTNIERVLHNVSQGTDPQVARSQDPNGDGIYTLQEALGQKLPEISQFNPTQIYIPGQQGQGAWQPIESGTSQFASGLGKEEPAGTLPTLDGSTYPNGEPVVTFLPTMGREETYQQAPVTYNDPSQVILSRYPVDGPMNAPPSE